MIFAPACCLLSVPIAAFQSGKLLGQLCVHVCVCCIESSSARANGERARETETEIEAGITRKRIGGGEPEREGWIARVRDRAEESVKLQQPGDKSFSLALPATASEG